MHKCVFLAALLSASGLALAQTTMPSWELKDGGRWQQVAGPATQPVSDATLDRVEEMIQNKQAEAAKRIVVAWLRTHKESPVRDRGIYLLGQANFGYGDRIMSFYNFDELMDKYPESRYYYSALQRQYDIADQFLRGWKDSFLGMKILERKEEATEMLYRIQQRAPGSPLAEKALLRVADHYYSTGEYEIAADAYASYVRGYPRSPLIRACASSRPSPPWPSSAASTSTRPRSSTPGDSFWTWPRPIPRSPKRRTSGRWWRGLTRRWAKSC